MDFRLPTRLAVPLAVSLLSACATAVSAQPVIENLSLPNPAAEGVTLAATLALPEGPGPFPGEVLVTGSGPQNRDGQDPEFGELRPFADWADYLTARGYAVLRYDDRGTAASTGDFAAATAEDLASDAMMAANDAQADFVVMLAGPAVDFREVFSGQYMAQQILGGDDQVSIDANQQFLSTIYAALDEVETADHTTARAYLAEVFDQLGLPYEAGLDMLSSDYMRGWVAHDMRAEIREFRGPVMGVYGEYDMSVDPVQNAAALGGLIDPRDGSAVRVLLGKNHLLQTVESPSEDFASQDHAISPDVLALVADWLDGVSGD